MADSPTTEEMQVAAGKEIATILRNADEPTRMRLLEKQSQAMAGMEQIQEGAELLPKDRLRQFEQINRWTLETLTGDESPDRRWVALVNTTRAAMISKQLGGKYASATPMVPRIARPVADYLLPVTVGLLTSSALTRFGTPVQIVGGLAAGLGAIVVDGINRSDVADETLARVANALKEQEARENISFAQKVLSRRNETGESGPVVGA